MVVIKVNACFELAAVLN